MDQKLGNNLESNSIKDEPPPILRYLVWIRKNWRRQWKWISIGLLVGLVVFILPFSSSIVESLTNRNKIEKAITKGSGPKVEVTNGNLTEKDITNSIVEDDSIVTDDDRLSQLEKELISPMPDGQILMEIEKNAREKKYGRVLELIGFLNTEQGRDGQRIRFINKLINDKNISLAATFVNQLELGHNIDKMKSKLAQESIKY